MAKKLFIGYDLGDGETITDMAILDDSQIKSGNRVSFAGMTMPDNNTPGQAIPTVFGLDRETGSVVFSSSIVSDPEAVEQIRSNFKRRPSDLIAPVDETRRAALIRTLQEGFPDRDTAPELYTEPLLTFADAVKQFTDALFTDGNYNQVIASAAVGCQEIVFSVGHPTRWDELDAAIYRAILMNTVIGEETFASVPASLVMAAESRAAFLYIKNNTGMADILPKGKCALLIDMGCFYKNYCSDMTRTFYMHSVDDEQAKIYEIVREAQQAACDAVKPGVKMSEIYAVCRKVIDDSGYGKYWTIRLGHFIGQEDHEKGDVGPNDHTPAAPGMIFSIEPGIYIEGFTGVRIEDLVLVTEDGYENLNAVDKKLLVV